MALDRFRAQVKGGVIHLLGCLDDQLKFRGHRVESEEIRAVAR